MAAQQAFVGLPPVGKNGSKFLDFEKEAVNFLRQKQQQPQAKSRSFQMADGDFIIFHGKAWHGSWNPTKLSRQAFLLQYITPDCPTMTFTSYDFPLSFSNVLPPVVLVSGDNFEKHKHIHNLMTVQQVGTGLIAKHRYQATHRKIVKESYTSGRLLAKPKAFHFSPAKMTPYDQSFGSHATPIMAKFSMHYTLQLQYQMSHEPHTHFDEELVYILEGKLRATFLMDSNVPSEIIASPGDIIYKPNVYPHSVTAISSPNATYLCIFYTSHSTFAKHNSENFAQRFLKNDNTLKPQVITRRNNQGALLDGPTEQLPKLHAHVTVLQPGQEVKPHADGYDRLIIVEDGQLFVSPDSIVLERGDVLFCPTQTVCGYKNAGVKESRHIAFEFHAEAH